jgi:hypothetical protein
VGYLASDIYARKPFDSTKVTGIILSFGSKLSIDSFVEISTEDRSIIPSAENNMLNECISQSKDYELIALSNHPDPTIRCYAFDGLY